MGVVPLSMCLEVYVKRWLVILLGATLIMGAACGGGDEDPDAGGSTGETEADSSPAEEESTAPEGGKLTVTGVDFAFQIDPTSLPAGETEVTFENDGKEEHQMIMARLSEDSPPIDELLKMSEKESGKYLEEEFNQAEKPIKTGESTTFTADLSAGTYAMVCFVANKEGPHAFQGMFGTFTVE